MTLSWLPGGDSAPAFPTAPVRPPGGGARSIRPVSPSGSTTLIRDCQAVSGVRTDPAAGSSAPGTLPLSSRGSVGSTVFLKTRSEHGRAGGVRGDSSGGGAAGPPLPQKESQGCARRATLSHGCLAGCSSDRVQVPEGTPPRGGALPAGVGGGGRLDPFSLAPRPRFCRPNRGGVSPCAARSCQEREGVFCRCRRPPRSIPRNSGVPGACRRPGESPRTLLNGISGSRSRVSPSPGPGWRVLGGPWMASSRSRLTFPPARESPLARAGSTCPLPEGLPG